MNKKVKIQDYILDNIEAQEAPQKKAPTKPKFEVLYQDGGDFVVSRKTKTTETQLVIICSQKQYYIKSSSGTKPLTEKTLTSFINGMENNLYLPDTFFECLPADKNEVKALYALLNDADGIYAESINQRILYVTPMVLDQYNNLAADAVRYTWHANDLLEKAECFRNCAALKKLLRVLSDKKGIEYKQIVKAFTEYAFMCNASFVEMAGAASGLIFRPKNLETLIEQFGMGGVYDFLNMLLEFDCSTGNDDAGYIENLFRIPVRRTNNWYSNIRTNEVFEVKYNPKDFFTYLTYQPYIQGYDVSIFVMTWSDVLSMEQMVFGKITDKYPKALASLHQKLQTECSIIQEAKEAESYKKLVDERYAALEPNSYKSGDKTIVPAKSREEILGVARAFSNCLASYVDRYANGNTDIYFMYENETPKAAIEIKNGSLRQAFQAMNVRPTKKQFEMIEAFCKKNGFIFKTDYAPC